MRTRWLTLAWLLFAMTTASAAAPASAVAAPPWPLLETYKGKVVLVDFWASWCSPCLQSFPWMNELERRYSKDGFVVLAVNMDQDRALADAFLKKTVVGFRIEYDPQGTIAQKFDVQAMPTSFLIDRSGNVRASHKGFREKQRAEREAEIQQLLKEHAP